MFTVYILFSASRNTYYVGQSENVALRFELHKSKFFPGSFTSVANDWEIVFTIECKPRSQAVNIESHIKRMKSRTYIEISALDACVHFASLKVKKRSFQFIPRDFTTLSAIVILLVSLLTA